MTFAAWPDGTATPVKVLLLVTLTQLLAFRGVASFVPFALALGIAAGKKGCWAAAFMLSGVSVTVLGIGMLGMLFGPAPSHADMTAAFALGALQFSALVALHPRWNARWAGAAG